MVIRQLTAGNWCRSHICSALILPLFDLSTLLRFGVNSVMRAAEKDDCSLVVINRDAQPRVLTEHLLELVKRKRIPCASITRLSEISEVTGIQAVTAIGFKPLVS